MNYREAAWYVLVAFGVLLGIVGIISKDPIVSSIFTFMSFAGLFGVAMLWVDYKYSGQNGLVKKRQERQRQLEIQRRKEGN